MTGSPMQVTSHDDQANRPASAATTSAAPVSTRRLDCHTPETAMQSLVSILGIRTDELRERFIAFDLESYFKMTGCREEVEDVLLRLAAGSEGCISKPSDTCWFHAARVPSTTDFESRGILPVSQNADALWTTLRSVDPQPPGDADWLEFRTHVEEGRIGHWSWLYAIKQKYPGPFAFLIREELDHFGDTRSVDYFACPESIADICHCYAEVFHRELLAAYQAATTPCVVKFVDTRPAQTLGTVARYLYEHVQGGPAYECNICFDSSGVAIAPEQILDVEWLPNIAQRTRISHGGSAAARKAWEPSP